MRRLIHCLGLAAIAALSACAVTPTATSPSTKAPSDVYVVNSGNTQNFDAYKVTAEEAKTHACPESVLEVGATEADCQCAEDKLFEIGQDGQALAELEGNMTQLSGDELLTGIAPPRLTAIEIIRIDAFEACGFFEDGHPVGQGL